MISHTPHYQTAQNQFAGWGPTIKENDYIASLFKKVTVLGFLHPFPPPKSAVNYKAKNIHFIPLSPSGGQKFWSKLQVLNSSILYSYYIIRELFKLKDNDWVYVRCPCNIGLLALFILSLKKSPQRWFKYAGNWNPSGKEALSYTLQRKILNANWCKGKVTINGIWPSQKAHLKSFLNPCLEKKSVIKITSINKSDNPYHFLFVGRVEDAKGIPFLIELAVKLKSKGLKFDLSIIGTGEKLNQYHTKIKTYNLSEEIHFVGELPHDELDKYYQKSTLILLPTTASEGWPKVLSEAMAYGCIPVTSQVSAIPQILEKYASGISIPIDLDLWANTVFELLNKKNVQSKFRENGIASSEFFTYETYIEKLKTEILNVNI